MNLITDTNLVIPETREWLRSAALRRTNHHFRTLLKRACTEGF
jgi:hypothetical protein